MKSSLAQVDLSDFESQAEEAARMLKLLANEKRLLILCQLVSEPEMAVGDLAMHVDLSQSALSQHLARLREEGLVATRRESQTIYYRLADPDVTRLLATLKDIYCP
jgi:ArsR family transcriptional regulator, virulence genes transcriptional regulator